MSHHNVLAMKIVLYLLALSAGATILLVSGDKQWWQKTVVYQIYPRSFKDTNGDGIGDLIGITQGLSHIKDAGVGAIWLSPIYKSPMYDFGYDITDFKQIQPEYGTMEDFENLLQEAKKLDIKVILDFVPNHSSNESEWFRLSVNRTAGYENYYIWEDGIPDPNNPGKFLPPNNWRSVFRFSAWEYNAVRGQYYLHQFVTGQPDLNYREPRLVEEMKNVLRFWLEKGVAGFRVDAVPFLFEVDKDDFGGKYPDEPLSDVIGPSPDDYNYLSHIYTQNQEPTFNMVYQWRAVLDEMEKKDGFPRVMLVEAYADIKTVMRYYGDGPVQGAHLPFNFELLNINRDSDARDIKFIIDKWITYMPVGKTANWVNGNHDSSRMASKQGVERADTMNMLALLLPGVALTYQGEELAMIDGEVSWEDTKDPQGCNTQDPINYYKASRDPARTPYQWDDTKNAGFSTGDKTWLPVASNYKTVNLKAQKAATKSHYKFYQDLVALRSTTVQIEGDLTVKAISENILVVLSCLGLGCNHIRGVCVHKTCQRTPQELCQMVLWACYEPKKKFELFYYLVGRPPRTAEKAIKLFAYGRCISAALSLLNESSVVAVANLAGTNQKVDLSSIRMLPAELIVYTASLNCTLQKGERVKTSGFSLSPYDAVVFIAEI